MTTSERTTKLAAAASPSANNNDSEEEELRIMKIVAARSNNVPIPDQDFQGKGVTTHSNTQSSGDNNSLSTSRGGSGGRRVPNGTTPASATSPRNSANNSKRTTASQNSTNFLDDQISPSEEFVLRKVVAARGGGGGGGTAGSNIHNERLVDDGLASPAPTITTTTTLTTRASAGVEEETSVPCPSGKGMIPIGSNGPGAYSGAPGQELQRLQNVQYETAVVVGTNGERNYGDNTENLVPPDIEGVVNPSEGQDNPKDNKDTKRRFTTAAFIAGIGVSVLVVVVAVVLLVVFLVAGDSSDSDETKRSTANTEENQISANDQLSADLLKLFPNYTLQALKRKNTPQSKAYEWLLDDPALREGQYKTDAQILQRFVLATFYYSTGGDNWFEDFPQTIRNNWLDYNTHECSWYSTARNDGLLTLINPCKGYNNPTTSSLSRFDHYDYTALHLSGNFDQRIQERVRGFLPPELGLLTNLQVLSCEKQNLRRSIPTELGLLSNSLTRVVLYQNDLTGTIPTSLFAFVQSLWLSKNPFTGTTIPSEVGLNSKLASLILVDAGIVGTLPKELFQTGSPSFRDLLMEGNRVSGSMPAEIGLASNLQSVQLSRSRYSGEIPSELGLLSQLTNLDLEGNRLEGSICSEVGNLVGLQTLNVLGNKLTGKLPTELIRVHQLRELKLSSVFKTSLRNGGLTGQIPSEYFTTTTTTTTTTSSTDETGESPNGTTVATFPNMTHLWIEGTKIFATIPTQIGFLSNLRSIRMGANRETPPWILPSELGLLDLRELTLQESKLFSTIPSEFGTWWDLETFEVSNNELTGTLPSQMGLWQRFPLVLFRVSDNPGLSGSIPDHFCVAERTSFGCAAENPSQPNNLCGCDCGPCPT